jgi:hypothetical protein
MGSASCSTSATGPCRDCSHSSNHGLFHARLYDGRQLPRISLHAPEAVLERIAGLEDVDRAVTQRVFDWQPIPAGGYDLGPSRLESWSLPHYAAPATRRTRVLR